MVACIHDQAGDCSGRPRVHDLATAGEVNAVIMWRASASVSTARSAGSSTEALARLGHEPNVTSLIHRSV